MDPVLAKKNFYGETETVVNGSSLYGGKKSVVTSGFDIVEKKVRNEWIRYMWRRKKVRNEWIRYCGEEKRRQPMDSVLTKKKKYVANGSTPSKKKKVRNEWIHSLEKKST